MSSTKAKTLRRRLFGSHLLVMGVALAVLLVGALLVIGLFELFGGVHIGGRGGPDEESGPFGLLVGLIAAVIASAFVSWRVSQRLVAPLEAISDATRQLATGRYDVRVPGADTVELDALANDVNALAGELDTTEQRRLRLIGDVAHELRNPLSTIEGTMEGLLDGVVEGNDDTYARIGREAARLRRLADDLSSLSAAGELTDLAVDAVELRELVADVVARLEPQAQAKGLVVRLADGPPVPMRVDHDRMTQVLTNVVGNAVQYTETGHIGVELHAESGRGVIEVTDTGRGLAADDQTRIFERFHRVDGHLSDGTGVGLAIAKLIVDAHGGSITASSAGLGTGTTVRIELPA